MNNLEGKVQQCNSKSRLFPNSVCFQETHHPTNDFVSGIFIGIVYNGLISIATLKYGTNCGDFGGPQYSSIDLDSVADEDISVETYYWYELYYQRAVRSYTLYSLFRLAQQFLPFLSAYVWTSVRIPHQRLHMNWIFSTLRGFVPVWGLPHTTKTTLSSSPYMYLIAYRSQCKSPFDRPLISLPEMYNTTNNLQPDIVVGGLTSLDKIKKMLIIKIQCSQKTLKPYQLLKMITHSRVHVLILSHLKPRLFHTQSA